MTPRPGTGSPSAAFFLRATCPWACLSPRRYRTPERPRPRCHSEAAAVVAEGSWQRTPPEALSPRHSLHPDRPAWPTLPLLLRSLALCGSPVPGASAVPGRAGPRGSATVEQSRRVQPAAAPQAPAAVVSGLRPPVILRRPQLPAKDLGRALPQRPQQAPCSSHPDRPAWPALPLLLRSPALCGSPVPGAPAAVVSGLQSRAQELPFFVPFVPFVVRAVGHPVRTSASSVAVPSTLYPGPWPLP
jgi:hypothetical protein